MSATSFQGRGRSQKSLLRSPARWVLLSAVLLAVPFFVACRPDPWVYAPGPDFKQTLTISAAAPPYWTGEPIKLTAVRHNEGWIRVRKSELAPNQCHSYVEPPAIEPDSEIKVSWIADPSGFATFGVLDRVSSRAVTFYESGEYTIQGRTDFLCGQVWSNKIKLNVATPTA